jgi:pimeloyl-ACP methyl ester carboxylesterase
MSGTRSSLCYRPNIRSLHLICAESGASRAAATGYAKVTLAEDIHELVTQLGLKHVYVVGHDIGGMVAYAYARVHPEDLSGAAIIDIPVPDIDPRSVVKSVSWA